MDRVVGTIVATSCCRRASSSRAWSRNSSRTRPSVGAQAPGADPHHLAGGAQRVEIGRSVLGHAGREDVGLEHRRRQGRALQHRRGPRPARRARGGRCRRPATRAGTGPGRRRRPARPRAAGRPATGGAAGAARRRRTTRARRRSGRNSPRTTRPSASSASSAGRTPVGADAEVPADLLGEERAVGAGEAGDQVVERSVDRIGERGRQADGQRHAERVAQPGRVLGRGQPFLAGQADLDGPPLGRRAGPIHVATGAPVDRAGRRSRAGSAGPSRRSRSWSSSASRAVRPSTRRCSSSSRSASTSGSISSRSSSAPSSSRSRSRSSARAAARRSASGASPSYM